MYENLHLFLICFADDEKREQRESDRFIFHYNMKTKAK